MKSALCKQCAFFLSRLESIYVIVKEWKTEYNIYVIICLKVDIKMMGIIIGS